MNRCIPYMRDRLYICGMSLEVREVTRYYGAQKALDRVSFALKKGELTGFLGPNGAGKSTLMKIIAGYLPASSGEVVIDGEKVTPDGISLSGRSAISPRTIPSTPTFTWPNTWKSPPVFISFRGKENASGR